MLHWLDPDRERAGLKYEIIRIRLIKLFACRGWGDADELADESINRVTFKVDEVAKTYQGDPSLYFYGVAHMLHFECLRSDKSKHQLPPSPPSTGETDTDAYKCLDECMSHLRARNRELVLRYHQDDGRAKISNRKLMAQELGIELSALRIRAHRIRAQLQKCVKTCLERGPKMKGFASKSHNG